MWLRNAHVPPCTCIRFTWNPYKKTFETVAICWREKFPEWIWDSFWVDTIWLGFYWASKGTWEMMGKKFWNRKKNYSMLLCSLTEELRFLEKLCVRVQKHWNIGFPPTKVYIKKVFQASAKFHRELKSWVNAKVSWGNIFLQSHFLTMNMSH